MNIVCLVGKLGKKPEVKEVGEKKSHICEFAVAVSEYAAGKTETVWIDCTAWGKVADNIAKYFDKGMTIALEGRLSRSDWKDKEDKPHHKYGVTVKSFEFGSSKNSIVNMPESVLAEIEPKKEEKPNEDDWLTVPENGFEEMFR